MRLICSLLSIFILAVGAMEIIKSLIRFLSSIATATFPTIGIHAVGKILSSSLLIGGTLTEYLVLINILKGSHILTTDHCCILFRSSWKVGGNSCDYYWWLVWIIQFNKKQDWECTCDMIWSTQISCNPTTIHTKIYLTNTQLWLLILHTDATSHHKTNKWNQYR